MFTWIIAALLSVNSWADMSGQFQTNAQDQQLIETMKSLDLSCGECKLKYKDSGTSVGVKLYVNGVKSGKWAPKCSANNIETQVVSYQLGRFLGISSLVAPSAYFQLQGQALAQFKQMLESVQEKNRWRRENRDEALRLINANPSGLAGVYTPMMATGSLEARGLANPSANTINPSHPIARFIKANGPKPSPGRLMSLDGVKSPDQPAPQESELELARQFSQLMVLDMLMGQWDRWSGGNVEAGVNGNRVFFVSRDNGGAGMKGMSHMAKYKNIVTRFDRAQIERVELLVKLLTNPMTNLEFIKALQIRTVENSLLERARDILEHVKQQSAAYGEGAFF